MITHWDIHLLREHLPNIIVKLYKDTDASCQISGRSDDYATVHLPNHGTVQVAWSTIVYCLNEGRSLRL